MQTSNPVLMSNPFSSGFGLVKESQVMTVRGTVTKTAILLGLLLLPAVWVWHQFFFGSAATASSWMTVGMFGGLALALATVFKKEWAPVTAPLYAIAQGLVLGGLSAVFEQSYPGLVIQAVGFSTATLAAMLGLYQSGVIRPTERFKLGLIAATAAIAMVYFVSFILGWFGVSVPFINGGGLFGILFSFFVVGIAALNFILDFDFIEQGARRGIPKYMEWYGAFALMVTLVWLYIEVLRLLAKLNERK